MSNQPLVLTNQFGEVSINQVSGADGSTYFPLPGSGNLVIMNGASTPVDGTTGDNIAGKGSLYTALDTGVLYLNTGTISSPVWTSTGTTTNAAIIAATLTAFAAGAGTVSSSDSILTAIQKLAALNNGTFVPTTQAVSTATAINTTSMLTTLANAGGGDLAATLAAPSSQDGQIKILKMITRTSNNFTLAMTNIAMSGAYTPTGTTTLTFSAVGHTAVLMAVGSKWVYLGGSAIAS